MQTYLMEYFCMRNVQFFMKNLSYFQNFMVLSRETHLVHTVLHLINVLLIKDARYKSVPTLRIIVNFWKIFY